MKRISAVVLGVALCTAGGTALAQSSKPYKEGQVTEVSYIKIKPGKFDEYVKFLDTTYKTLMEANKKAGLIVGYAVYAMQARNPHEPDLMLTVTYTNMGALDKIEESEAVAAKVVGSMEAQNKAYIDREALREVLGSQLIRELVLK
jgi:L-rhamnose mutarotase